MKTIIIPKPFEVQIIDTPMPEPKEGEALLRVLCGGICGSDLGTYRGTFAYASYPRIPGHEFSAEIVDIKGDAPNLKKGMVVTANPYFNCGSCYSCERGLVNCCEHNETLGAQRDGAFSEYITMPIERIYDGKGLAPNLLAAIEPFCISYHGAVTRGKVKAGDKVLVIGSGTIGALAAIAASIAGILIGIPVLRLKGDYLAIVTLAFGEIIKSLVNVLYIGKDSNGFHVSMSSSGLNLLEDGEVILKGPQGISNTPKDSTFLIGFILVMLSLFIVTNLMDSRTGRAIMSIRDNRIAAESVGINITKYKLLVFTISAAIAGCAGVLYSHNLSSLTANTNNFGYNMSIMVLVYVVLGGLGSIRGSVIAAAVLYALPELLRGLADYRMLIYSIILIVMMIVNNGVFFLKLRAKIAQSFRNSLQKKKNEKEAA